MKKTVGFGLFGCSVIAASMLLPTAANAAGTTDFGVSNLKATPTAPATYFTTGQTGSVTFEQYSGTPVTSADNPRVAGEVYAQTFTLPAGLALTGEDFSLGWMSPQCPGGGGSGSVTEVASWRMQCIVDITGETTTVTYRAESLLAAPQTAPWRGTTGAIPVVATDALEAGATVTAASTLPAGTASSNSAGLNGSAVIPLPVTPIAPVKTGAQPTSPITLQGTAQPGTTIIAKDRDGAEIGTVVVGADGNWTLPLTRNPAGGIVDLTSVDTTQHPAVSSPTVREDLNVATPTITGGTPAATPGQVTLSGTAEPNATIAITDSSGATVGTATADANGNWTATYTDPSDGKVNVTATIGGLPSPPAPYATPVPATGAITAPVQGSKIGDATPEFRGTAEPGSKAEVIDSATGAVLCTVDPVPATGNWACEPETEMNNGAHEVAVRVTNNFGKATVSAPTSFDLNATPPAQGVITSPTHGTSGTGSKPTFTGTAEPGAKAEVIDAATGTVLCTVAPVPQDGQWSCTSTHDLAEGSHQIQVRVTNAYGLSSLSDPITITTSNGAALAATGTELVPAAALGSLLLAAGVGTVLVRRRRLTP